MMIDDTDLHEVFGDRTTRNVVSIGLGDSPQEVDWVGVAEIKVDNVEDVSLRIEDLVVLVAAIGHVEEVGDGGTDDFFVFRCDEKCGDTDELEFYERDDTDGEESVDDVGSEEDGFGE